MVILAQLADHRGGLVNGSGNEVGIVAMSSVPVASVEYSDSLVGYCGKRLEESDESVLIIDLRRSSRLELVFAVWEGESGGQTFNSGLEDMLSDSRDLTDWKKRNKETTKAYRVLVNKVGNTCVESLKKRKGTLFGSLPTESKQAPNAYRDATPLSFSGACRVPGTPKTWGGGYLGTLIIMTARRCNLTSSQETQSIPPSRHF